MQVRATERYFSCGLHGRADVLHIATAPKKIVPFPEGLRCRPLVADALLGLLCEDAFGAHVQVDRWAAMLSAALRSVLVPLLLQPRSGLPTPAPGVGADSVQGQSVSRYWGGNCGNNRPLGGQARLLGLL